MIKGHFLIEGTYNDELSQGLCLTQMLSKRGENDSPLK